MQTKDVEAILKSQSLAGLPDCYSDLKLIQTIDGQVRLMTQQGAAKEVADWVRLQCDAGKAPSGKEAERQFRDAPYGWSLEVVQVIVATLLRDGQITLTSAGQSIKQALTPEARKAIANNTAFRALTIRPRESTLDPKKLRDAAKILQESFGKHSPSLTTETIASILRDQLGSEIPRIEQGRDLLRELRLPGEAALDQGLSALRALRDNSDEDAIVTFLESSDRIKTAIGRGRGIEQAVTEPARPMLERARAASHDAGAALESALGAEDPARKSVSDLRDLLEKETFYEHLAAIKNASQTILDSFQKRYERAFQERRAAYESALAELAAAPGWSELSEAEQAEVAGRLRARATEEPAGEPWRSASTILGSLRDQTDAAPGLLQAALEQLRKLVTPQAVEIQVRTLLSGPISTPEELDAALGALRERIEKALADGTPVLLV